MKVTIAQLNPIVGDIDGNLRRIADVLSQSAKDSPDLLVFPELFLVGYPPRDLLEKSWFIEKVQGAVHEAVKLSAKHPQTAILLGTPLSTGKNIGGVFITPPYLFIKAKYS